jgi:hypothetical protein
MLDQAGVGGRTSAPQQDQVKVIFIRNELELIARRDPTAALSGYGTTAR